MIRWILMALVAVLIVSSTGLAQQDTLYRADTAGGGWFNINGMHWSGKWGGFMAFGRWVRLGPTTYIALPAEVDIARKDSTEAIIAFAPHLVFERGDFLFSFSTGLTNFLAPEHDRILTYTKVEASISWILGRKGHYSDTRENANDKFALTVGAQHIIDKQRTCVLVGITFFY